MDTRRFHKLVLDAARRLLPRNATIVCAVSGGPDSIALLHALHRINALRKQGWRLCAAHLDHHLPPNQSGLMAAFTRARAAALDIEYTEESVNVPARAASTGESIEEAGRKVRYDFLARAARRFHANYVAVAHQADDQAETVLHRLLRGTSLKGLAGIPEIRPLVPGGEIMLVRPLLALRRMEILSYLRRRDISFLHDVTNDDPALATRNFIRHELLPLVQQRVNPNAAAALIRLGRHARHASDFIRAGAESLFEAVSSCQSRSVLTLRVDPLSECSPALLGEVILIGLGRLGAGLKAIGSERIHAVAAALDARVERRIVQLAGGFIAERRGKYLYLKRSGSGEVAPRAWESGHEEPTL